MIDIMIFIRRVRPYDTRYQVRVQQYLFINIINTTHRSVFVVVVVVVVSVVVFYFFSTLNTFFFPIISA